MHLGRPWPASAAKAISSLVHRVVARLVDARRLLVGPMNRPENRYDSDGWLCQ
jgi:hypothetical protein